MRMRGHRRCRSVGQLCQIGRAFKTVDDHRVEADGTAKRERVCATESGSVGEIVGDGHSHAEEHRPLKKREDKLDVKDTFIRPSDCGQSGKALEGSSVEKAAAT